MSSKKRIGIVVQRYGLQVNGGAEVHARMVAEKLALTYDVTVLTSCALDYNTWDPVLPVGNTVENGINVLRFENKKRAPRKVQGYYGRKVRGRHLPQKIFRLLNKPNWWLKIFPQSDITEQDSIAWLEAQGPAMPDLLTYLAQQKNEYNAFVFFTALYYPTAMGILKVPEKSILIPTMHDEKASYFPIYQKVMAAAEWIFFNTKAEQDFSQNLFSIKDTQKEIVAVGIESGPAKQEPAILQQFNITKPYIVYVGRIDTAKGCDILISYFTKFLNESGVDMQLVMVGKLVMPVINHPAVLFTGFVEEYEKLQLVKQAEALAIPSLFESLSLVLLESFACKVPVIANAGTEVLKNHIDKSNGGWYYNDYAEFKKNMQELITDKEAKIAKGLAGYQYVQDYYSWEKVIQFFDTAIEDIDSKNSPSK